MTAQFGALRYRQRGCADSIPVYILRKLVILSRFQTCFAVLGAGKIEMEALTMEVNSTKQQSVGSGVPVRRPYQAPQLTSLGEIQSVVRASCTSCNAEACIGSPTLGLS